VAQGETDLAEAIRSTQPDSVSDPVKSAAGWHLVYVQDFAPERVAPLRKVRAVIAAKLLAQHKHEAVRTQAEKLRENAQIEVDQDALARVTPHLDTRPVRPAGEAHQ